jgi:hypothetical protein
MSPAASNVYPYVMALPVAVEWMTQLLLVLSFSSFLKGDKCAKQALHLEAQQDQEGVDL